MVSPSSPSSPSSSSLRWAGLCSVVLRLSSPRLEDHLEIPSSLPNRLVDCLEVPQPSSPRKADRCLGALQPNRLRAADNLVHNSLASNKEDRFLAARNNRLNNKEALSLGAPNNPPPDRRPHYLEDSSSLRLGLHCSVAPNSHKQVPHNSEVANFHYSVPLPQRHSLNNNHLLWERLSVRSPDFLNCP